VSAQRGIYSAGAAVTVNSGTIAGTTVGIFAKDTTVSVASGSVSGRWALEVQNCKDVTGENAKPGVSVTGGTITGTDKPAVYANGSDVTISAGTITSSKAGRGINATNGAAVTITGGTVTVGGDNAIWVGNASTLNVSGGEVKTTASDSVKVAVYVTGSGSSATISGSAAISAVGRGIDVNSGAKLKIEGGSITSSGEHAVAAFSGAAVTITGGTIESTVHNTYGDAKTDNGYAGIYASDARVEISGGSIAGGIHGIYVTGEDAYLRITGSTTVESKVTAEEYNALHKGSAIVIDDGAEAMIASKSVNIKSTNGYGIFVLGAYDTYQDYVNAVESDDGAVVTKLTLRMATVTAYDFAVGGNGTAHGTDITIGNNAKVSSTSDAAVVYLPQYGSTIIEGTSTKITGSTGSRSAPVC
jgi:hypothetical protein